MKYPVIFKTFSVLFSLQSDERWIVPIFGGTIILLLAFSAWRLCTEKKDKWRYRRMMLLSLILWGIVTNLPLIIGTPSLQYQRRR